MSESEKGGGGGGVANVDFLSTHPANAKRIKVSNHIPIRGMGMLISVSFRLWRNGCPRCVLPSMILLSLP